MEDYMNPELMPKGYSPALTNLEVQQASDAIKQFFENRLRSDFNLFKHTAPIAFKSGTGVNDDLDGTASKAPVGFHVPNVDAPRGIAPSATQQVEKYGFDAEVVQSLAKWKRIMLQRYGCDVGTGLFCESTSIRKGYKGDVTHSNVCDQWDWEVRVTAEQRNVNFLKATVSKIYRIIKDCETMTRERWPALARIESTLPDEIHFISAEELHAAWPDEDVHGREDAGVRKWGAIFIIGMGWPMQDGSAPEEVRAPDYDDWNLNGDIIVRHPLTGYRHELSSMGVRVDAASLMPQLKHRNMEDRAAHAFHRAVLNNELPLSMGGGIGISRLLMLLLQRGHIGEVQVGIWADAHEAQAKAAGFDLIPNAL